MARRVRVGVPILLRRELARGRGYLCKKKKLTSTFNLKKKNTKQNNKHQQQKKHKKHKQHQPMTHNAQNHTKAQQQQRITCSDGNLKKKYQQYK